MEILTAGEDCFFPVYVRKNYRVEAFYRSWALEREEEKEGKGMREGVEVHRELSTDR